MADMHVAGGINTVLAQKAVLPVAAVVRGKSQRYVVAVPVLPDGIVEGAVGVDICL